MANDFIDRMIQMLLITLFTSFTAITLAMTYTFIKWLIF